MYRTAASCPLASSATGSVCSECVLATLPGGKAEERLCVVLIQSTDVGSKVCLRQQTWSEGVGWYNQFTIDLDHQQVADLRNCLGSGSKSMVRGMVAGDPPLPAPAPIATDAAPQVLGDFGRFRLIG
ncbi:MAG: hypothetical protein ACRC1K_17985 [Planctomycetia bacterium]